MWGILVSLIIGIIIGLLRVIPQRLMKYNSRVQQTGVILLLFSMGASTGANKALIFHLKSLGLKAFTFAAATTLFSIIVVYAVSTRLLKGGKNK